MLLRVNDWVSGFIMTKIRLFELLLLLAGVYCSNDANAQHFKAKDLVHDQAGKANYLKPLGSDSLSSGFLIIIPDKVEGHYHAGHSEHVYVLEGEGTMHLNNDTFNISAGDYVFIPRKSVHGLVASPGKPVKVISVQSPFFDGKDRIPAGR
jgi:mannose-6-phosphate isomerase-like protein (cupin superfamily)